jgi:hypothetical protein
MTIVSADCSEATLCKSSSSLVKYILATDAAVCRGLSSSASPGIRGRLVGDLAVVGERKGVELPRREVARFGVPLFTERREVIEALRIMLGDVNWASATIPFKFAFVKGLRGGARAWGETEDRRRSLVGPNGVLDLG